MIKKIKELLIKYKSEILYLIFGVLTTVISVAVFELFTSVIPLDPLIANIISWIFAVLFAFVTNKKYVFEAEGSFISHLLKFYLARLFTLGVEELIILIFVSRLSFDATVIKLIAQVVIIILNYVISKIFVFKKTS